MSKAPLPTARPAIPAVVMLTTPHAERDQEEERAAEMASLLDTAGRRAVARLVQHCDRPTPATYIGRGKVEELAALLRSSGAEEVFFDCPLTARQQANLEQACGRRVYDYEWLILEIFARNARTEEAMLAVELAQAEYLKGRLRRLWTHLDRQHMGGAPGGSGFLTGTGETQIEMDRRLVRRRIQALRERLARIEARRERMIAARAEAFQVCLVGYTNAGKSTLMNALTGAGVLAEDRLFATLDTRTARLPLPRHGHAVLSDTVGFIRDLPPKLIASFHATLGEVRQADLLLHVVDAASPAMERQIAVVEEVLAQIGADHIPAIMVFNKSDRPFSRTLVGACKKRYRHAVSVSALTGQGLDELREAIAQSIERRQLRLTVRFPASDGALNAFLHRRARVEAESYEGEDAILTIVADDDLQRELAGHPRVQVS